MGVMDGASAKGSAGESSAVTEKRRKDIVPDQKGAEL